MSDHEFPEAKVERVSGSRWPWLIPLAAVILAVVLVVMYVVRTGPTVTIRADEGGGLEPGDLLRCRGIAVGEVTSVSLADDLAGVDIRVQLTTDAAEQVARAGSRFWVVRPSVSLAGVSGLETIAGPRYLAVIPGNGPPQRQFIALPDPPVVDEIEPEGLEILLMAEARGGLLPGAPVLYRQMPIGTILSVGLASDGASVEMRAYIRPSFVALVRSNSRFWNLSGAKMRLDLSGLNLQIESLASLIVGGVGLATPDAPGKPVSTGHRFRLAPEVDKNWLAWQPAIPIGNELVPPGTVLPDMARVRVQRTGGTIFRSRRQYRGWALPMTDGVIAPASLLDPGDDPEAVAEIAGQRVKLEPAALESRGMLTLLHVATADMATVSPKRFRAIDEPEDLLLVTDTAARPMAVAAARLDETEQGWRIDSRLPITPDMTGAAAVARRDGAIVGQLVVTDGQAVIVPLR